MVITCCTHLKITLTEWFGSGADVSDTEICANHNMVSDGLSQSGRGSIVVYQASPAQVLVQAAYYCCYAPSTFHTARVCQVYAKHHQAGGLHDMHDSSIRAVTRAKGEVASKVQVQWQRVWLLHKHC